MLPLLSNVHLALPYVGVDGQPYIRNLCTLSHHSAVLHDTVGVCCHGIFIFVAHMFDWQQLAPQGDFLVIRLLGSNTDLCLAAVLVMRAWAFTGKNRAVLAVQSTMVLVLLAIQIWTYSGVAPSRYIFDTLGAAGCFRSHSTPQGAVATTRIGASLSIRRIRFHIDTPCRVLWQVLSVNSSWLSS